VAAEEQQHATVSEWFQAALLLGLIGDSMHKTAACSRTQTV
jgi:hypothetical protein